MASPPSFSEALEGARDLPAVFELVKEAVRRTLGKERGGLMLGLAELGGGLDGVVGAFYPIATNIIVMNRTCLRRLEETAPRLFGPYSFVILLHEYLHALGWVDEYACRERVRGIAQELFGASHVVTAIAHDLGRFLPNLVYPVYGWRPEIEPQVELVGGFDRSSTAPYIG